MLIQALGTMLVCIATLNMWTYYYIFIECKCIYVCVCIDKSDSSKYTTSFSFLIAKFPDYKSTWSPDPIGHNPTHLSNKMWKNHISSRNTTPLPRPPPGLTNPKPSSPWSSTAPRSVRGWGTQDSRLASGKKDLPKRVSLFSHTGLH